MKLLTFRYQNQRMPGVLSGDMTRVIPVSAFGLPYPDMLSLIRSVTPEEMEGLRSRRTALAEKEGIGLALTEKCAPIPCPDQDVICLGINYMAHAEESARFKHEEFNGERPYAVYFSKRVSEAVADGGLIDSHSDIVDSLDYEAELAFIISRDARNVPAEKAAEYVFGYTVLNDVSARTIQNRHKQWYFGKSLDGFTPMGPWIVTADEVEFPPAREISCLVNGELRQHSNTAQMIFGIPHIISELSRGMTLRAGTIISTGTPSGAGMGFQPPKYLKPGDQVVCQVEGIGTITNEVR